MYSPLWKNENSLARFVGTHCFCGRRASTNSNSQVVDQTASAMRSQLRTIRAPSPVAAPPLCESQTMNDDETISTELNEGDTTTTWDSTFQHEIFRQSAVGSATICSHAVSVGGYVYGGLIGSDIRATATQENYEQVAWWTWKQSLSDMPHNVRGSSLYNTTNSFFSSSSTTVGIATCVASNSDGTVIAVATDAGVVSLLRGSDGASLATRRVCSENDSFINLTWIQSRKDGEDDVLLIETPLAEHASSGNLILVSNVQGERLNHSNATIVAEAARSMQIHPFSLEGTLYTGDTRDLLAMTGCYLNESSIRLIACDGNGKLVAWDYDTQQRQAHFVQDGIALISDDVACHIDFDVGLFTRAYKTASFVLCTALIHEPATPNLFWFDPIQLRTACRYEFTVEMTLPESSVKVLSVAPVESHQSDDAIAAVVATKTTVDGTSIGKFHVVQALIGENDGMSILLHPHIVYTLSAPETTIAVSMTSLPTLCTETNSPYSFRCKVWQSGDSSCVFKEFLPDTRTSRSIGAIRSFLRRGQFDAADEIVANVGSAALINDEYADFYPSEIALHSLTHSLTAKNPDAIENARSCLRRLASGAVSGNDKGIGLFLESVDVVIHSASGFSFEQYNTGLRTLATSIQTVSQRSPPEHLSKLRSKEKSVADHIIALEFVAQASPTYPLSTPFANIRSPIQLYDAFVQERKFSLAECLCHSSLHSLLTSDDMVLPLLQIDAEVDPREYAPLLRDVVIPNLTISDELFYRLELWSCRVAEGLDDRADVNLDLEAAILLLQVSRASDANADASDGSTRLIHFRLCWTDFGQGKKKSPEQIVFVIWDPFAFCRTDRLSFLSTVVWFQLFDNGCQIFICFFETQILAIQHATFAYHPRT
jgi:hypothetical protein